MVYKEEIVRHGGAETELGYQTENLIVNLCSMLTTDLLYKNKFQ
jgi:hypothetical protein